MTLTIANLLESMEKERKKPKHDEDDDFIFVQKVNLEWPVLFERYFLSTETRLAQTSTSTTSDDDLIFYVTRKTIDYAQHDVSKHSVEVFRHHDTKRQPKFGSLDYDWEETTNLNLVLHQFEYTVTIAVCVKPSDKHLQIINRLSTRVYASPSRRDMENKGVEEKITYPHIFFSVDNFEDKFCEMIVNEGQMVCVELVAKNPGLNNAKVLFIGSIKYEALKKVYETRATTTTRVAQRISLGVYTKRRVEFVRMRGPNGKGHAEMAVSRYLPMQSDTRGPESISTKSNLMNTNEESWNRRRTIDNGSVSEEISRISQQQQQQREKISSDAATSEIVSNDIRQELTHDAGGFLGRTLSQAMSWVRKSNSRLNQTVDTPLLQSCLTYLTLPCDLIVKDILESASTPLLTNQ